jgi:peroxiredoxin Q/BCP
MLHEGDQAPGFLLPATPDQMLSLAQFQGKSKVVLYFYSKDNTSGCTRQAQAFRDHLAAFQAKGAVVIGVSPDSLASHQGFSAKHGLNFPLVADVERTLIAAYGVSKDPVAQKGVNRTTFVIDAEGTIQKIFRNVKVDGHVEKVLAQL